MESIVLNELIDIVSGYAFPSSDMVDEGIPIVKITNIKENGFLDLENTVCYSKPLTGKLRKYLLRNKDVLVCMTGATIGKVARKLNVYREYLVNQRVAIIRAKEEDLQDFVYYILTLPSFRKYVEVVGYGAAQPNISANSIGKFCFLSYRDINIQRYIGSVLSTYDTLIENNTKRIRLLEKMAENLYKEWFVRFRFPGHEKVEMVNGLPKGWKVIHINDCCETVGGGTPSTSKVEYWNGDIKWVTPTDLTSKKSMPLLNIAGRITEEGLTHSSAKLLPPYTILMTSRASIGYLAISLEPVCTNQGFISIVPQSPNLLMYFLYMLKNRRNEIISNANGATFLEISKGRFRKMKMVMPNVALLNAFQEKTLKLFNMVLKLENQNTLLARQRDLLLPRLMSGKLEVKAES